MKRLLLTFCCLLPFAANASFFDDDTPNPCVSGANAMFEPEFSNNGAISPAIVKAIAAAKKHIRVAAHDLNSKAVTDALIAASRANVDVKILLDKNNARKIDSGATLLKAMSLFPHVAKSGKELFSGYIVIDERDIILGDFAGFADEQEEKKNDADAIIIRNAPDAARRYLANWQKLWNDSDALPPDKN